jgi:hypothetical protein
VPEIEWKPLPPLWPSPAAFADVDEFLLLVFTQDSVPTWGCTAGQKQTTTK